METPTFRKLPGRLLRLGWYLFLILVGGTIILAPQQAVELLGGRQIPPVIEFWQVVGVTLSVWAFGRFIATALWLRDPSDVVLQRLDTIEQSQKRIEAKLDQLLGERDSVNLRDEEAVAELVRDSAWGLDPVLQEKQSPLKGI